MSDDFSASTLLKLFLLGICKLFEPELLGGMRRLEEALLL